MARIKDYTAHEWMKKAKATYQELEAQASDLLAEGLKLSVEYQQTCEEASYWFEQMKAYKAKAYA